MLYSISIILLFVLIMILPKKNEKMNLILTLLITFIVILAYNTSICYALNLINIPITLLSLSIINFVISALLIYKTIRKKQIQKYEIDIKDVIGAVVICIVTVIAIGINSHFFTRINYVSMDSFAHYKAAQEFYQNEKLANKYSEEYTTSRAHMPMGYVNIGILFKVFEPITGLIYMFRIYVIFETIICFCCGVIFYFCLKKYADTVNKYILIIVFSVVYVLGYPLNAFVAGFHYLGIGIMYFTAILYVVKNIISKDMIETWQSMILLALLNIGLILSYSLFCPPVYLAEFAYFIYKYKKGKNIKKLICFTIFTLVVTGLIGIDLILRINIKNSGSSGIELDGWIYKNDWSNFILFVPFAIYYIYQLIRKKEKEDFFSVSLFILYISFVICMFVGRELNICSSYYYYKTSYIIWFIVLYIAVLGMLEFLEKKKFKYIINVFMVLYCMLMIYGLSFVFVEIVVRGKQNEDITKIVDIYGFNGTSIEDGFGYLSKGEIELLDVLNNKLESNWNKNSNKVFIMGGSNQEKWIEAFTGYYKSFFKDIENYIQKWNSGEYEYLVIFDNRKKYSEEEVKDLKLDFASLIYQNEAGRLYKIKNNED